MVKHDGEAVRVKKVSAKIMGELEEFKRRADADKGSNAKKK